MRIGHMLGLELLDEEITWGELIMLLAGVAVAAAVLYGWMYIGYMWGTRL